MDFLTRLASLKLKISERITWGGLRSPGLLHASMQVRTIVCLKIPFWRIG